MKGETKENKTRAGEQRVWKNPKARKCQECGADVYHVPFRDVCSWRCYWRSIGQNPKPVPASETGTAFCREWLAEPQKEQLGFDFGQNRTSLDIDNQNKERHDG